MQSYAHISTEEYPVNLVEFSGDKPNDENFTEYLDNLLELYKERKPFTLLFDASQAYLLNIRYQRMQADWLKRNEDLIAEYCLGTAYVIPNPLLRTALKGIFAFQNQPIEYKVVSNRKEGEGWCKVKIVENLDRF